MARVLLVDDDAEGVELRRMILERHGHAIDTATAPTEALQSMIERPADCVICDLRLPQITNGLALIRDLRRQYPDVRIVILSGIADSLRGREEGEFVDVALMKPVRSEQLLAAIQRQ
jgi:two-component system CheB/CheR fusion protein